MTPHRKRELRKEIHTDRESKGETLTQPERVRERHHTVKETEPHSQRVRRRQSRRDAQPESQAETVKERRHTDRESQGKRSTQTESVRERHPHNQRESGRDTTQMETVKERDLHRQKESWRDTHTGRKS